MLPRIVLVTAIASWVLLFGAPEDASACHKGDPPIPHGAATCDGGGGGYPSGVAALPKIVGCCYAQFCA